jgi:hypothetical protein
MAFSVAGKTSPDIGPPDWVLSRPTSLVIPGLLAIVTATPFPVAVMMNQLDSCDEKIKKAHSLPLSRTAAYELRRMQGFPIIHKNAKFTQFYVWLGMTLDHVSCQVFQIGGIVTVKNFTALTRFGKTVYSKPLQSKVG